MTHLAQKSRPIRIAVDISIWLFKVHAGRGGNNPEVRTLFFRLLKLLALPIHPVFVFDGHHKPPFKRGKAVGQGKSGNESALSLRLSKRLIDLFSFPRHTAPGEAEAECAQLQMAGVVDAVMSDDVDTLMFGSRTTIMNYSRENSSGTDAATHVNLYRTEESHNEGGRNVFLDRAEMILFAMLSGGDYLPSGVPGCGYRTAAEISRAGFGSSLLEAIEGRGNTDTKLIEWRKTLQQELHENKSGFFQRKHRSIKIPETFPDRAILYYYTNPVVSTPEEIEKLRGKLKWDQDIDVVKLQNFVDDTFGWTSTAGLRRFIKVFSAPLVSYRLRLKIPILGQGKAFVAKNESYSMQKIYRKRAIYANDATPEFQFEYVPADVVNLELNTGTSGSSQQQCIQEPTAEQELDSELDPEDQPPASGKRAPKEYDPLRPEKIWIFETVAEIGAPEAVAAWKLEQERKETALNEARAKKLERAAARAKKKTPLESGMKQGEIFRYANVIKPGTQQSQSNKEASPDNVLPSSSAGQASLSPRCSRGLTPKSAKPAAKSSTRKKKTPGPLSSPKVDKTINPFTLAKGQGGSWRNKTPGDVQRQDTLSSVLDPSLKDTAAEYDPFVPGSSPPPLPQTPPASRCGQAMTTGTTMDPITISSSPLRPSTTPTNASPSRSQVSKTGPEEYVSHNEPFPEPQTPPISSELLSEDFPFPSPTNLLTPTPKPKAKPHKVETHASSLHPRDRYESRDEDDEDDSLNINNNQTSDPFISSSQTNIPSPTRSKSSTAIIELSIPPIENKPTPSEGDKSAYLVDSYDGYWTCRKDEGADTDLLNPDSGTASSGSHDRKGKKHPKKFGRVSILDLS